MFSLRSLQSFVTVVTKFEVDNVIEGFSGKRVLGILLKAELCQEYSKFRMQFCLRVLNNVLHAFFPSSLLPISDKIITYAKKQIFPRESSEDHLLNEKQKKPFVLLSDEVTIIP